MKLGKKILALFTGLLIIVSSCPALAMAESTYTTKAKWTILVYMCGSDLESDPEKGGSATADMNEMINAKFSDEINLVVETGGASAWQDNFTHSDDIERFVKTENGLSRIDTLENADMGDPETLKSFLTWAGQKYQSDKIGLIFWDHGGGSISGVCSDENYGGDKLTLAEIRTVLSETKEYYPNGFDFIGFDACLMATLETASVVAPYSKYMYASEETEPSTGWDYTSFLNYIYDNLDTDAVKLGVSLCDAYFESCAGVGEDMGATFSVTDLVEVANLASALNDVAAELSSSQSFTDAIRALISADGFGGNNKIEGYTNMIDIKGMLNKVSDYSQSAAKALTALENTQMYYKNGSQHYGSGGLSIYYPLKVKDNDIATYEEICPCPNYLTLVKNIADKADVDKSLEVKNVYLSENGRYTVELSNMDEFGYASCTLFKNNDDGSYIFFGEDDDVIVDKDNGIITDNFDGSWLRMADYFLPINIVTHNAKISLYTCQIKLNGEETNLRIKYDWDTEKYSVIGTWSGINPNSQMADRTNDTLKNGDIINIKYTKHTADGDVEYFYSDDIVYSEDIDISYTKLNAGEYEYRINLYNLYGNESSESEAVYTITEDGTITFKK